MTLTSYGAHMLLGSILGQSDTTVTTCYIGLTAYQPSADGSGFIEPAFSTGYRRVLLCDVQAPADWLLTITNNSATNAEPIIFNEASAPWGDIAYFGLFDAATGGHLILFSSLEQPITTDAAYKLNFKPNKFNISIA